MKYIDRTTRKECTEKIYGHFFLKLLYHPFFRYLLLPPFARLASLSRLYGAFQKSSWSRFKIKRFIRNFHIDTTEFADPVSSFRSFNDFFIRKIKPRPIAPGHDVACLPADARYLAYENISAAPGFWVKGHKFSLDELLLNPTLAHKYAQGSMLIARLAPVDYHRFHFPVSCLPDTPRSIPGPLYSVNPIALKTDIHILARNKRTLTLLSTKNFGTIVYIEVGATYVGTIHQTFIPKEPYAKGDEKGYFSFGGSSLILLFEPFRIQFDQDLLDASSRQIEVLGKMGQSLGRSLSPL